MAYHDHHHFELDKILHSKMNKVYAFRALHTFAISLIGLFVPIYLFKSGFSLVEIILYNVAVSIIFLFMIPIVVKVIKDIGFKYTLLMSIPFYLLHIFFLNFIVDINGNLNYYYFNLSWVLYGFYLAFFWLTFHSEVALNGSNKHRGSQMGTLQIITGIFGTAAPILGGFVLDNYSYLYLFGFSSIIVLLGMVPLLRAKDIKLKHYDFEYKNYLTMLNSNKDVSSKRAFAFEGFNHLLLLILWPIVVFQLLDESYFNYGALITFISFFSIIMILYIKSYFDKRSKTLFLQKTSKALSLSWFFKSLVMFFGMIFLFIIESIAKFVWQIFSLLFTSIFYNNAKKHGYMDYIILRELYIHISKIIFGMILMVIFILYGTEIYVLNAIVFSGVIVSLGLGHLKEL